MTVRPRLEALEVGKVFTASASGRRTVALEGLSLAVGDGEFLAVTGPSGCGKTTLLQIMLGLVRPTSGRVLVDGRPVAGPGRDRAVVFQEAALLPWRTALGNAAYGLECLGVDRRQALARARRWLARVGLDGFEDHYPHELSGGMQQRVNLARALAVEPEVLLMDEPFASLDAQTREGLQEELLAIWTEHRRTVVFVTHDIAEAVLLADRVAVLSARPGRVRAVVPVELPRPRDAAARHAAPFREAEAAVRALLRGPGPAADAGPRSPAPGGVPARRWWPRLRPEVRQ